MYGSQDIIVRIVGGLGNQMFQYASAYGLARSRSANLWLDVLAFNDYKLRSFELDRLTIPQNYWQEPIGGLSPNTSRLSRIISKLPLNFLNSGYKFYREPHFHYDAGLFTVNGNRIVLDGYFQSPKYFDKYADEIRQQFQLTDPLSGISSEWADKIQNTKSSVSLHVRRGDYVTNSAASAVHMNLPRSYYLRALDYVNQISKTSHTVFLFSDDPDYVEREFAGITNAHVVRGNQERGWEDMFLMSMCSHNIIANSTYSWWGAWLNTNKNKTVVAPSQWFTPKQMITTDVTDLFPESWHLLQ